VLPKPLVQAQEQEQELQQQELLNKLQHLKQQDNNNNPIHLLI
jgi:hypothetical protein